MILYFCLFIKLWREKNICTLYEPWSGSYKNVRMFSLHYLINRNKYKIIPYNLIKDKNKSIKVSIVEIIFCLSRNKESRCQVLTLVNRNHGKKMKW